jgi:hypothetical protein
MNIKITTKSGVFTFKNVFYDEEDGLLKILLNKTDTNSIIFDYVEMKEFLEECIKDKYYNNKPCNLEHDSIIYKICNAIIFHKIKINLKNNEVNSLDNKNYRFLWFLYNYFESYSFITPIVYNFTIYDYIFDNQN